MEPFSGKKVADDSIRETVSRENRLGDAVNDTWYENYFGPDYLLIDVQPNTGREVEFIRKVLGIGEGVPAGEGARGVLHARVLDTGCGYGRHLVPLLECGVSVVGYDLSVFMLGEAAKGIRGGSERNPSIGRRAGARPVRSPGPPVLPFIRLRDQHVQLLRVFRQGGG